MSRPPPGGADTMIFTARLGYVAAGSGWACAGGAIAAAARVSVTAASAENFASIDRPRGRPTASRQGILWERDCLPYVLPRPGRARVKEENNEDRPNRRDPAQTRGASRRHLPRPHHGGRRARRARQFPALV